MLSYDIFLLLLLAAVGLCVYNQARLRNDILNIRLNIQAVRRGLIRERSRIKKRGILRNRELMKVARNIENSPAPEAEVNKSVEWSGPSRRISKK